MHPLPKATARTIGVIGGLGPEATLDFFAKVIAHTPAAQDQDHLHLIINNNPKIPNRNEALAGKGPSAGPALAAAAKALERAGADCLVMVCNTAHAYQADIEAAVTIPFISMVDETVNVAACQPATRQVGVLATDGCLLANLYQAALESQGLHVVRLAAASQKVFMQHIYGIKAGHKDSKNGMQALAEELIEAGAELIIAGCTEVPLVLDQADVAVPLISSTDVLIEAVFKYAAS